MHAKSSDRPTQAELIHPLLQTLHDFGGRARPQEVAAELAKRFHVPQSVLTQVTQTNNGELVNVWKRHVRFTRQKAKALGYVESTSRGAWQLTEAGRKGITYATQAIVVELAIDESGTPRAARIDLCVGIPTTHMIATGDARHMPMIENDSIPLVITSIPYHDLKDYGRTDGQLATIGSYRDFVLAMDDVLREIYRTLIPGGRAAINVGDVLRSRRQHGEHHVLPLHAHLATRAMRIGYRILTGILWHKPTNIHREDGGRGVLGTPGMPNGIIPAEVEHILLMRKPGPYRSVPPTIAQASRMSDLEYRQYFRPVWNDISGASTTGWHPAPFPIEIPFRLAKMFSFVGDLVWDPCAGSSSTAIGCAKAGRNSLATDIEPRYVTRSIERIRRSDLELLCA